MTAEKPDVSWRYRVPWLILLIASATATSMYVVDPWSEPMSESVCVLLHAATWGTALLAWRNYRRRLRQHHQVVMLGYATARFFACLVLIISVICIRDVYFRCEPYGEAKQYFALDNAIRGRDRRAVAAILARYAHLDYVPDFDARGDNVPQERPLITAIGVRDLTSANVLLDRGAALLGDGDAAIVAAARTGDVTMLQMLVDRGAKVSETPTRSDALWSAVSCRNSAAVAFLLKHGAPPNMYNPEFCGTPNSVLHLAYGNSDLATAKLLKEHGAKEPLAPPRADDYRPCARE